MGRLGLRHRPHAVRRRRGPRPPPAPPLLRRRRPCSIRRPRTKVESPPAEVGTHPLLLQVSEEILLRSEDADTTSFGVDPPFPGKLQPIAPEARVVGFQELHQALGGPHLTNRHVSRTPGGGGQINGPHHPVAFTASGRGLEGFHSLLDPVHCPLIVAGHTDPAGDHGACAHKKWFLLCGDVFAHAFLYGVPHPVEVTLLQCGFTSEQATYTCKSFFKVLTYELGPTRRCLPWFLTWELGVPPGDLPFLVEGEGTSGAHPFPRSGVALSVSTPRSFASLCLFLLAALLDSPGWRVGGAGPTIEGDKDSPSGCWGKPRKLVSVVVYSDKSERKGGGGDTTSVLSTTLIEWMLGTPGRVHSGGSWYQGIISHCSVRYRGIVHRAGIWHQGTICRRRRRKIWKIHWKKEVKFRSPSSVLGTTEATRPSSAHKEIDALPHSKIIENVVYRQIYMFLEEISVLPDNQYG